MLWLAFHFHPVLLIFVTLWPISTLCVADMVHAVADMVCGRYRRFPSILVPADPGVPGKMAVEMEREHLVVWSTVVVSDHTLYLLIDHL